VVHIYLLFVKVINNLNDHKLVNNSPVELLLDVILSSSYILETLSSFYSIFIST